MKTRIMLSILLLLAVFLVLASTALASSTWYVNGISGSDGNACTSPTTACKTIGHAISLASSGDSIRVAAATYKENLTISFSLKIVGSSANTTIIDGGGVNTVVTISSASAHVTLSKVTIRNGCAGCPRGTTGWGGGIYNGGTLAINNSTISGNRASSCPLPRCSALGGGIYNGGTLVISNSTISGNTATSTKCLYLCTAAGGGIHQGGSPLTISNSTVSGNTVTVTNCGYMCSGFGGGIYAGGSLTINNSTISGNSFQGFFGNGKGGGIYAYNTTILQNSIVANSPSGGNCYGTITSKGYNLSSDGTCNFNKSGDLNNTDPKLGPLQNNGGPTQTQALLSGSLAIDAGNPSGCTDGKGHLLKTDQRGKPRPDKEDTGGCDMGAYERQKD
jgi:hypothetical protein